MVLKTLSRGIVSAAILGLTACGSGGDTPATSTASTKAQSTAQAPAAVTLASVIAAPRRAKDAVRDKYRNPKETLEFFGVGPGKTVAEIWPGWYTDVIAPYLAANDGQYVAVLYKEGINERLDKRLAAYKEKYADESVYGTIQYGAFLKDNYDILPENSVDILLSFRNVHNWMGGGYGQEAFNAFYAAVKPGGTLGIVEHRLPESAVQNPRGQTGYVQESYMKALAKKAGFEFVESSEVNANPKDTADHPYGVWTLPPRSRLPKDDDPNKDDFDAELYKNIGESDRATLKFRKPL